MESDDLEYISHHEIVERIGKDSFVVNKEEFIPDVIHGIRHKKSGAVRLYMVEIDRNTESVSSYKFKLASFQHKLEQYHKYIAGGLYKKDFGINGGMLLVVVTNNITHMHNLIDLAGKSNFMLFASVPKFGVDFAPPSKPFELVESPLLRPGKEPFYMSVA